MRCFNFHCQGESHKAIDKVCQDYSYSNVDENGVAIAIVCDGHGGNRYFRSDVGAKLAAEVTERNVRIFLDEVDAALFAGQPYTPKSAIQTEIEDGDFKKENQLEKAFRQLFASIISCWYEKIKEHAASHPLTEKEKSSVEQKYQDEFTSGGVIEKTYGCTLMAYVCTPTYWFAFHLGDGKCISFDNDANWKEPIPWDDRCFLNRTTSLCDSDAINEFRYCYEGDGNFPIVTFLGSDGMDDSFGEESNLVNFYVQVAKSIAAAGIDNVAKDIVETLPQLSKIGSQDDMSIAFIYDEKRMTEAYPKFINWQIATTKSKILAVNNKILGAIEERKKLSKSPQESQKVQIELQYAQTAIEKGYVQKQQLVKAMNSLLKELRGEDFEPYSDEVGTEYNANENTNNEECLN